MQSSLLADSPNSCGWQRFLIKSRFLSLYQTGCVVKIFEESDFGPQISNTKWALSQLRNFYASTFLKFLSGWNKAKSDSLSIVFKTNIEVNLTLCSKYYMDAFPITHIAKHNLINMTYLSK